MKQHIKTHITGSVEFVVRILNATFVFSLQITTNINFDFSETIVQVCFAHLTTSSSHPHLNRFKLLFR